MAMALSSEQVAVVYRRKICLYSISSTDVRLLRVYRFGFSADFASIAVRSPNLAAGATTAAPIFVLTLTTKDRIRIYHVTHDHIPDGRSLLPALDYTISSDGENDVHYPQLSDTGGVLTWISIPHDLTSSNRAKFRLVTVPPLANDGGQAPREDNTASISLVKDEHLPALYWEPSYDFNEGSGLAVFGNPFGELVVCEVHRLDRSTPPRLPKWNNERLVSSVCYLFGIKGDSCAQWWPFARFPRTKTKWNGRSRL